MGRRFGLVVALIAGACGDDDGRPPGDELARITVTGEVQFGLVENHQMVGVSSLLPGGGFGPGEGFAAFTDPRGHYEAVSYGPSLVHFRGFHFDPILGDALDTTLEAIVDPGPNRAVGANVNVFTTIAVARIRVLVAQGKTYGQAIDQADAELYAAIPLPGGGGVRGTQLDMFGPPLGYHAYLAALSAVIGVGIVGTDAAALAADFGPDGALSPDTVARLEMAERRVDPRAVTWLQHYVLDRAARPIASIPDLRGSIDADGDGTVDAADPCPRGDHPELVCDVAFATLRVVGGNAFVGDIDKDGHADVLDLAGGHLYRGTAAGGWDVVGADVQDLLPVAHHVTGLVDFDHDGGVDIFDVSQEIEALAIRRQTGPTSWSAVTDIWVNQPGVGCGNTAPRQWAVTADWNGDDLPDFLGDSGDGCMAQILSSPGAGVGAYTVPALVLDVDAHPSHAIVAQLDGAGPPEVALTYTDPGGVRRLGILATDGARLVLARSYPLATPREAPIHAPLVADFTGDAIPDILVEITEDSQQDHLQTWQLYRGAADGRHTAAGGALMVRDPIAGDFDHDGTIDLVDAGGLYRNTAGGFAAPVSLGFPAIWTPVDTFLAAIVEPDGRAGLLGRWAFVDPRGDDVRGGIMNAWLP